MGSTTETSMMHIWDYAINQRTVFPKFHMHIHQCLVPEQLLLMIAEFPWVLKFIGVEFFLLRENLQACFMYGIQPA